ncbi:hypothetical protein RHGRI_010039 [Rhododendron griersonianum]|uniref:Uncharacterized protein n=1 Tax=Rhododendron griersonianum TaxID=479676 RepID=A0AAV6KHN5_9ERIC|nr:hypothetical protein RHGRI_010039 [Rhododendron griersonianum]
MLHGEDFQLLQEPLAETSSTSVLVATHGSSQGQRQLSTGSSFLVAPSTQSVSQPFGSTNQSVGQLVSNTPVGSPSYYDPNSSQSNVGPANLTPSSSVTASAQYIPPQFLPTSFRNFPRGRGKGPRMPCDICGRFNHTTNYCYYRPPFSQMVQQGSYSHPMVQQFSQQPYQQVPQQSFHNVSWRPPAQSVPWMNASNPWLNAPMNAPPYPPGIPMFHYQAPPYSRPPMVASQATFQGPNTPSPQAHFAGFTDAYTFPTMNQFSGMVSGASQYGVSSQAGINGGCSSVSASVPSSSSQPWFTATQNPEPVATRKRWLHYLGLGNQLVWQLDALKRLA